jgi:hypothetical protein
MRQRDAATDPGPRTGARRRVAALLLAALLLGSGIAWAAGPGPEMTYTARPAHHGDPHLPPHHFVHALEPGSIVTDAVRVFNLTARPMSFDVYTGDVLEREDGGITPVGRHLEVTGPGTWITPERSTLTVPPYGSELVAFTIAVPAEASAGAQPAALLVEPHGTEERPDGISMRARIGLPVLLEVLGEIDLGVELGELTWRRERGNVRFDLPVANTGDVTFTTDGTVVVSRSRGAHLSDVLLEPSGYGLAPGGTTMLRGTWDAPWIGRVTAVGVVDATVGERAPRTLTTEPINFWLVPWRSLLVTLTGLVLAGVLAWDHRDRWRTWRAHRREEAELLREFRAERARKGAVDREPAGR